MSNRVIAQRRGTSLDAVKFHTRNIAAKLDLPGRAALRHWKGAPLGSAVDIRRQPEMDSTFALGPLGQVALTVSSLAKAEPFYRDVLGLPHLYTFGDLAFFDCGGTRLFLTASDDAAHDRNHSVLYFRVPDIHAAVAALEAREVAFLGAPHMIHRHEDGTEEWMAFFVDPDGNTLAVMSQVRPAAGA